MTCPPPKVREELIGGSLYWILKHQLVTRAQTADDADATEMADTTPATPIAVIPAARGLTAESRAALPKTVPHADAAFSAGRAALLGAALASRSADLFEAALTDRLHEPYRAESSPLLGVIRESLPAAALGATLSGAGPTVIVWARTGEEADCTNELRSRFPNEHVLPLTISQTGAGPT